MIPDNAPGVALAGPYRDLLQVARGRDGVRYSATVADGRAVEVLSLARDLVSQVVHRESFEAELRRVAQIRHEGLAELCAWGATADGGLHVAYQRGSAVPVGTLTAAELATLGAPVARALAVLHEARVIHGAIRTERLSLADDGRLVLEYAGVFSALVAGGVRPSVAASALSEPPFLSPEQQVGGAPGERGDVYGLGASLYEVLTGKAPFGGRMTSYVMATVLRDDPDTPESNPSLSAGPAVDAILRAIEAAPDDRWAGAVAFASALEAGSRPAGASSAAGRRGCLPGAAAALAAVMASVWLASS